MKQVSVGTVFFIGPHELPATLFYDSNDPYAVEIIFGCAHTPKEEIVTWVVAREALVAGLEEPTGNGDVRIRPWKKHTVLLDLVRDGERAELIGSKEQIGRFLAATILLVPVGQETCEVDMDDAIEALIGGTE